MNHYKALAEAIKQIVSKLSYCPWICKFVSQEAESKGGSVPLLAKRLSAKEGLESLVGDRTFVQWFCSYSCFLLLPRSQTFTVVTSLTLQKRPASGPVTCGKKKGNLCNPQTVQMFPSIPGPWCSGVPHSEPCHRSQEKGEEGGALQSPFAVGRQVAYGLVQ